MSGTCLIPRFILGIVCLFYIFISPVSASEPSKSTNVKTPSNTQNKSVPPVGEKNSDQTGIICDPDTGICIIDEQGKFVPSSSNNQIVTPLEFKLNDAYGREVRSGDYLGLPVLIVTVLLVRRLPDRRRAASASGGEISCARIAGNSRRIVRQLLAGLGIPEALPSAIRPIAGSNSAIREKIQQRWLDVYNVGR